MGCKRVQEIIKKLFGLNIDKSIGYSLALKFWQSIAGVLSIATIAWYMDSVFQGYYYTFVSLIALQAYFELGLYTVIFVNASHAWANLNDDQRKEDAKNKKAYGKILWLGRFVFFWYGFASILFAIVAYFAGVHFFSIKNNSNIEWQGPWLYYVLFSAITMWLTPFLSILEGCDQFASSSLCRLVQSTTSSLLAWIAMANGAQLWSLSVLSAISALVLIIYLTIFKREFFRGIFNLKFQTQLQWRKEIFPMQWRLAVQGMFSYLSFPLYPILLFRYVGEQVAGQFGMTIQIVNAMQSIALVFIFTKAPQMAAEAAKCDYKNLNSRWDIATKQALLASIMLNIICLAILLVASNIDMSMRERILPLDEYIMLAASAQISLLVQAFAVYIRAHKIEKFTLVGVVSGCAYGILALYAVLNYSSIGVAISHLLVTICITFPFSLLIYIKLRNFREVS